MRPSRSLPLSVLAFGVAFPSAVIAQAPCRDHDLAVQVLGSGGPFAGSERASTGYLVWRDGRAVIMVDVGGGTFLRFGEAGARLDDLSLLAISHLHPDHVTDLPGLLWLSDAARSRPLPLVGPPSGGIFPDIATFVDRLFAPGSGAFPALGGTLGQAGRGIALEVMVADAPSPTVVFSGEGLEVTAFAVPHGAPETATPSIAYRIRTDGRTIVFSSDQNGTDERFVDFARDADLLVMHFAASEVAAPTARAIHATPGVVGRIARDAQVRRLVLSHVIDGVANDANLASHSGTRLADNVAVVQAFYSGPLEVATDLQCFALGVG
jgi:ribonuclease BN (tRNA processing enzyme)